MVCRDSKRKIRFVASERRKKKGCSEGRVNSQELRHTGLGENRSRPGAAAVSLERAESQASAGKDDSLRHCLQTPRTLAWSGSPVLTQRSAVTVSHLMVRVTTASLSYHPKTPKDENYRSHCQT